MKTKSKNTKKRAPARQSRALAVAPGSAMSVAQYAKLREKVGQQIQRWLNGYSLPAKYPTVADAALAAVGIKAPKGTPRPR